MAGGSVIKGSGTLIIGRVAGLVVGFVLLMLLTRRSAEVAGVFRTTVTFLVIMDFLPLLGMHRWLAIEISHRVELGSAIFVVACWFATSIAALSAVAYLGIASLGFYGADTSACLEVVALGTIPSALN